jgi:hypothetical protein
MKKENCLGIWMDHSIANLMEFTTDPIETKTIESPFTHQEKEHGLVKSESLMHNKEQHEQKAFYKQLEKIISGYTDVILFGPTDAKMELYNILKADNVFANIKIEVAEADKMTENQQHAFVKKHFSKKQ